MPPWLRVNLSLFPYFNFPLFGPPPPPPSWPSRMNHSSMREGLPFLLSAFNFCFPPSASPRLNVSLDCLPPASIPLLLLSHFSNPVNHVNPVKTLPFQHFPCPITLSELTLRLLLASAPTTTETPTPYPTLEKHPQEKPLQLQPNHSRLPRHPSRRRTTLPRSIPHGFLRQLDQ